MITLRRRTFRFFKPVVIKIREILRFERATDIRGRIISGNISIGSITGSWYRHSWGRQLRGERHRCGTIRSPTAHRRAITSHRLAPSRTITNRIPPFPPSLLRSLAPYPAPNSVGALSFSVRTSCSEPGVSTPSRFPPSRSDVSLTLYQHIRPLSTYFPGVRYRS